MKLEPGDAAPSFTLEDQDREARSLEDFAGTPLILYFYPKDETSGCTAEACDFRDGYDRLEGKEAEVLGVSPDSAESHRGFIQKHDLPFPLLVDPEHEVAEAYGAWGEKKNYGRTYEGIIRSTFLIDGEGRIARSWYNVRVKGHVEQVLEALEELAS